MSPANVYRFFPCRDAINEAICRRVVNEVAEIAFTIARTRAPALEKLEELLTAVHHHNKMTLLKEKHMHDLIVAAMQENWAVIKAHIEQMVTIFEAIIREGIEVGGFEVEDPAEAARAVKTAFIPFFHPILIEHCLQHGEDTEAGLEPENAALRHQLIILRRKVRGRVRLKPGLSTRGEIRTTSSILALHRRHAKSRPFEMWSDTRKTRARWSARGYRLEAVNHIGATLSPSP
jgi:AcrR family transcriptional regulator